MKVDVQARFWPHVQVRGRSECWLWIGERNRWGYGVFFLSRDSGKRQRTSANRVSLEIALGRPLSDDECACHTCDNPPCVNPAHLWAGSSVANTLDRDRKGRTARGSRSHKSKLTECLVELILATTGSNRQVGNTFGVSESTIALIRQGKTWKHVERIAA